MIRLLVCVTGVYATFLLWAIAQERLSQPFPSYPPHPEQPRGAVFPSTTFINVCQSVASCGSALVYLLVRGAARGGEENKGRRRGLLGLVGWDAFFHKAGKEVSPSNGHGAINGKANGKANGNANGSGHLSSNTSPAASNGVSPAPSRPPSPSFSQRIHSLRRSLPVLLLQVSACQTLAAPIGFASLRYISYPTMVLGKSCKLIPVLLLNVLIYRRRFKPYKYAVVALVSAGISMFMLLAPGKGKGKHGKGAPGDSAYGLVLLGVNLLIDGLTNSTQDEIFTLHPRFTGQQMMFTMSFLSLAITLPLLLLPPSLPRHLLDLASAYLPFALPSPDLGATAHHATVSPLTQSLAFIQSHPSCLGPLVQYALLGGLGQLFIFETISHFGSLTLVMLTVTRKLFTMLLSVVLFDHRLTTGQWAGVAVVFGGIGLEAAMKRREIMDKQIAAEQHKSRLKAL